MTRKNGPWTIEESTRQFQNKFIDVVKDCVIQPDGERGTYATVSLKPGIAILPLDADGIVYLTKQFRYAIARDSIEVASGSLDQGETPDEAARRELKEELGIQADDWRNLGSIDLDTSIVRCPVQLFLAQGLHFADTEREGTEAMETVKLRLEDAIRMVMRSEITHAASCVLILKARDLVSSDG